MHVAAGIELVRFSDLGSGDLQIQFAINGALAPMIDEHKSSRDRFRSDSEWFQSLARGSELLLHLYGDARNPLTEDEILRRQERGF